MILSKSLKLSVLALCLASLSSSSAFAKTTRCSTACDEEVTAEKLALDTASLLGQAALFYAYLSYANDKVVSTIGADGNEPRNKMADLAEKAIAAAWFGDLVKDLAKNVNCFIKSKVRPVLAQAQAAVSSEA